MVPLSCVCITSFFTRRKVVNKSINGNDSIDVVVTKQPKSAKGRNNNSPSSITSDSEIPKDPNTNQNNPNRATKTSKMPSPNVGAVDTATANAIEDDEQPQIPKTALGNKKKNRTKTAPRMRSSSSDPTVAANVTTANETDEQQPPPPKTSLVVANKMKKRRVSLSVGFADYDAVIEIPHRNDYEADNIVKEDIFYVDADYMRFRASEQKRYDKLLTKRLQAMVMEKMQPIINEKVASGATLEDIEAMVPKTQADMIAYLGLTKKSKRQLSGGGPSSFVGLNGSSNGGSNKTKTKQQQQQQPHKTIRNSRSSIQSTETTTNPQSASDTDLKRTIRSSRSSIEIITKMPPRKNDGGSRRKPSVLEAAAIATEAAAELIAWEGE